MASTLSQKWLIIFLAKHIIILFIFIFILFFCSNFAIKTFPYYHCKCWRWKSLLSPSIIWYVFGLYVGEIWTKSYCPKYKTKLSLLTKNRPVWKTRPVWNTHSVALLHPRLILWLFVHFLKNTTHCWQVSKIYIIRNLTNELEFH